MTSPGQYRVWLVERSNESMCEYAAQYNAEYQGTFFGALLSEDAGDKGLFVYVTHLDLRTMFSHPVLLLPN